jgi:phosphoserine phosphatase RsbU/P
MEINALRALPLFAALSCQEAEALLAEMDERIMPEGSVLMVEGQPTEYIYALLEGEVSVFKAMGTPSERLLGIRGSGTILGEMSIFSDEQAHTATVVARTPLRLLEMRCQKFDQLIRANADIAYSMLRAISRRLQETDDLVVADLREKNRQLTEAYRDLQEAQARVIEQEKLERELQIAGHIQRSILPQRLPAHPQLDFGATMIPARLVGGDFYDFIPLPNAQIGVVIGDVCDKGIPAALYMALVYSAVRLEAVKLKSPGETLRAINRHLVEISHSGLYVTLIYGILNLAEGVFSYARAGHPYPLLLDRDHHARELSGRVGQPLGLFTKAALDEQTVTIPQGGTLLIFSDGLSETVEARAEALEAGLFCEQILAGGADCSAQELCERMWMAAGDAANGSPPISDDFTVVAIRRS